MRVLFIVSFLVPGFFLILGRFSISVYLIADSIGLDFYFNFLVFFLPDKIMTLQLTVFKFLLGLWERSWKSFVLGVYTAVYFAFMNE